MENLFTAVKRESAVDIVINNIKQLLIDRRLLPGDKLPSELEISEGLGVSRGSVREAMKILSAFGKSRRLYSFKLKSIRIPSSSLIL